MTINDSKPVENSEPYENPIQEAEGFTGEPLEANQTPPIENVTPSPSTKIQENSDVKESWSIPQAEETYGIKQWGDNVLAISDEGDVTIKLPNCKDATEVSLLDIAEGLRERGLDMPVMVRFENLIDHQISSLNEGFTQAIKALDYQSPYRGAFPIKVNQQSQVVSEIVRFGERYHHGLEAGSKAELLVAMASIKDRESVIICNGYKDEEFIDLGLQLRRLDYRCFFVVETPSEVPIIIARAKALGIEPYIGLRLKLTTQVDGHWSEDSGDRSIFGLNASQLIDIVDQLKAADMLNALKLVHFHLGSQIPNIRNIRDGVREACRYYIDLIREGAPLGYLDLGGGLAVDYDGSSSTEGHSRNYSLEEYCVDIIEAVKESLDPLDIPHPVLVSESGRATVAKTAVLLFNILDVGRFMPTQEPIEPDASENEAIQNLWAAYQCTSSKSLQESYNDALYYRDRVRDLFGRGDISLRSRALGENLSLAILQKILDLLPTQKRLPAALEDLPEQLADIYYGNFSVFQSLPDAWAIGQVFPVMPIHRLNEKPTQQAIIADLTCDCDGKLNRFAHPDGSRGTLPLHQMKPNEEYYVGVFLVGAYQETLGDLHNLFGDANVASVRIDAQGGMDIVHEQQGDTIADVLSYVEYDTKGLFNAFRQNAEQAVREKRISVAQRQSMLKAFKDSLDGYTYFER